MPLTTRGGSSGDGSGGRGGGRGRGRKPSGSKDNPADLKVSFYYYYISFPPKSSDILFLVCYSISYFLFIFLNICN
jgi:hypothetical protein